jgi:hypothetical protein
VSNKSSSTPSSARSTGSTSTTATFRDAADTKSNADAKQAAAGDVKSDTSATSKNDVVDYPGQADTEHPERSSRSDRDELAERDATIEQLRKQLAAINAQPDGAATEMQKAIAALSAEVQRMKAGVGLVPVPEPSEPDPYLYTVVLGCGDRVDGQHPHATHHFCEEGHGTQRVDRVFPKSVEQLAEQLA